MAYKKKKPVFSGRALLGAVVQEKKEQDVRERTMPGWEHGEYGMYVPEVQPYLDTESDVLYWEKITALVLRKWRARYPRLQEPAMAYCLMWPPGEAHTWGGVSMVMVDAGALDQGRKDALAEDIRRTRTEVLVQGPHLYVCPFFEWGLADYWEEGWYDK